MLYRLFSNDTTLMMMFLYHVCPEVYFTLLSGLNELYRVFHINTLCIAKVQFIDISVYSFEKRGDPDQPLHFRSRHNSISHVK